MLGLKFTLCAVPLASLAAAAEAAASASSEGEGRGEWAKEEALTLAPPPWAVILAVLFSALDAFCCCFSTVS